MGFSASVFQPSTLRMLIWPEASKAQNNIAAISAEGSTVCVLIRRLNSSCSRSIALVVRTLRHWLGGRRVKVNKRSAASSRLSATARCLILRRELARSALGFLLQSPLSRWRRSFAAAQVMRRMPAIMEHLRELEDTSEEIIGWTLFS